MNIRVLIADDQAMVRAGFRKLLESEADIVVVGEAENGTQAVDLGFRHQPDIVLMDIRMPGLDGIEATRRLLARTARPRVVILTTFDLDEYLYQALAAGASGFLLKDATPDQLIHAIHTVADGHALLSPQVTRKLIETFVNPPRRSPKPPPHLETLTPREKEVLPLLARGNTNAEIAQHLFLGEATVKTHVANILAKLDLRDRVQAVVYAYENGLVEPGTNPDVTAPS